MENKELLELAAKACGLTGKYSKNLDIEYFELDNMKKWNPILSYSDCLQMEIYLKIHSIFDFKRSVWTIVDPAGNNILAEHHNRQRASTMAAAEIGRQK